MTYDINKYRLTRPGTALGLLICIFFFCLVLAGLILPAVMGRISNPVAAIRIATVIQDLLIFIIPAIATAMIVTKLPARLLAIDRGPGLTGTVLAVIVLLVAVPAINWIVEWNKSWHLPESMAAIETYFRQLEEAAQATSDMLIKGSSVPGLIVSVLIVGVLAGFSEELFFRGALQRIMGMTRLNHHAVVWSCAIIFSLFHLQMFGFVPRMLLGAFFGYLLVWSGSLWLPVILHITNNSLVGISEYYASEAQASTASNLSTIGSDLSSPAQIAYLILSVLLTALGIFLLYRHYHARSLAGEA